MARMAANRPMGGRRGKDEVNTLRKPRERGCKPNGPTWQERQPTDP